MRVRDHFESQVPTGGPQMDDWPHCSSAADRPETQLTQCGLAGRRIELRRGEVGLTRAAHAAELAPTSFRGGLDDLPPDAELSPPLAVPPDDPPFH